MSECTSIYQFLQCTLLALLFGFAIFLLLRSHSTKHKWVLWGVGIVWLLGTLDYWYIYSQIKTSGLIEAVDGWLPALIISAISSAQLFVGSTRIFDNGFQELFFSDDGYVPLIFLSVLSLAAVMLSAYVIFNVFFRRVSSKWRLSGFPRDNDVHIFFGNNSRSQLLAENIVQNHKGKKTRVIIVEYPDDEKNNVDDSFVGSLYRLIDNNSSNSAFTYLRSKKRLCDVVGANAKIERILDLRGLDKWLFRKNTSIYLLSNDEDENLRCLTVLYNYVDGKNLHVGPIYCHARREGLRLETEHEYRKKLNFSYVDSSNLSVRQILREDPLSMPVNYVSFPTDSISETGTDLSVSKRGYVSGAFNLAIFGFGELGHEAFNFIYEFGAFPIRDGETIDKCPWHAHIFDKNIIKTDFLKRYPGFNTHPSDSVSFYEGDFNEEKCWPDFKKLATLGLNYIVICSGNDDLNLEILLKIDNCYEGVNIEKGHGPRIMVKYSKSQIESLFSNQIKNVKDCFQFFGVEKNIWKFNIISDELFVDKAVRFSTSYKRCADIRALDAIIEADKKGELQQLKSIDAEEAYKIAGKKAWDLRELSIANAQNSKDKNSSLRKRAQDMANAWHCYTKEHLIDSNYLKEHAKELADLIPVSYPEGTKDRQLHAPNASAFQLDLLENLAVCEKLRWNASHIVLGYKYGGCTDDDKKEHNCLKAYSELADGRTQHYDWLVVKNTLLLCAEKHSVNNGQISNE